ncbi:MAG: hypothetical protein GX580_12040 [Candidatus Hydrogenedens sp.]|nr:hypothetical protein [Candidatus Hydrogenedentota bacterium]NLF58356.1 hypothetical protein [Candidatus Hydrogenedens sp.]
MAADRTKVIKVTGSLIALSFSGLVLFAMFGPEGCGPSEEEQKIVASLNRLEELIEKGGYVKKITVRQEEGHDGRDSVYGFEADVVNDKGVPIGRLRSQRIEGFGMMKPRFLWFKEPGVAEDWPARPQGDRRRGDGRGPRGEGGRPPGGGPRPVEQQH